jgi:hypothetical protein
MNFQRVFTCLRPINGSSSMTFYTTTGLLNTAILDKLQRQEKLNLGLFGWHSSPELNTNKLDNSPRFPSVTYTASSDKRFRSYGILRISKTVENCFGQDSS